MHVEFSSICHSVRKQLIKELTHDRAPSLGQVQQLVAAAIGYRTVAAYRASTHEAESLEEAVHLVIDERLLIERYADLGLPAVPTPGPSVLAVLQRGLSAALPQLDVHANETELVEHLESDLIAAIDSSEEFGMAQAETNASGGDYALEFDADGTIPLGEQAALTGVWQLHTIGTCTLEPDSDRPYTGHQLAVAAVVEFQALGRRVLGDGDVVTVGAGVDDRWREADRDDEADWLERSRPPQ